MRFVDLAGRLGGFACAAVLTGCASRAQPLKAVQQAVAPAASALVSAPAAALAAATTPAAAPVSAQAQRAFDDATRALRAGRTDEAERGFRALLQSNPELAGPHANLGIIHRQAGRLPDAVAALETAVRLSPKQPVYLNQLGVAYRAAGQFDKAREAYDSAIALDPNYAAPHLNLGILHDLVFGDSTRALLLYDRYLALSPGGDGVVSKWVADLKNRKPAAITVSRKE